MATLLDEHLVQDSLEALAGWTGSTRQLERTVTLPADQDAALRARVQEAADAMDHHPAVEQAGEGTRYVLTTHSEGGVTELDITLASRISDLLQQVTGVPEMVGRNREESPDLVAEEGRATSGPGVGGGGSGDQVSDPQDTPTVGVPGAASGTPQVPLPDADPGAPEPGATPEQEPGPLSGR